MTTKLESNQRGGVWAALAGVAFLAVILLCGQRIHAMPRSPWPPLPEQALLFHEGFDEDFYLGETNATFLIPGSGTFDESWSGYALNRSGDMVIPFIVPAMSSIGHTNVSSDTAGTLRFWMMPFWSSQGNGATPGTNAVLLEMDAVSGGGSAVAWTLQVSADGNTVSLVSGGAVVLQTSIEWQAGQWHCVALEYDDQGGTTALYIDGVLASQGGALPSVPPSVGELVLGSTWPGTGSAGADIEEFYSFGGCLGEEDEALYYGVTAQEAAMGPVTWQEVLRQQSQSIWTPNNVFDPDTDECGCVTDRPVYITNLVVTLESNSTATVQFDVQGGTNGVFYDVYTAPNLVSAFPVQWTWLCQVESCNSYILSNQPPEQAFYVVMLTTQTMTVAFGDDSFDQCEVPFGLSNAVAVAAGGDFSLALLNNGTVIGWGDNTYGEIAIPQGLSNVVAIAAGEYQSIALTDAGTVVQWGQYWDGGTGFLPVNDANATQPPASNVVAVAAGAGQALALMADGTVQAWGWTGAYGTHVPAGLAGVVAIGCGWDFNNALLSNGTVVSWGFDLFGQTDVPEGLSNVTAIATGAQYSLALRTDGTVVAWGYDGVGQTEVPSGLSNVVAVAAGGDHSMALLADGSVVAWGDDSQGQINIPLGMGGVKAISAGFSHCLAILSGIETPVLTVQPENQYAPAGGTVGFTAKGQAPDIEGVQYQWLFDGVAIEGATGPTLTLTNTQASANGDYQVVVTDSTGSITSMDATFTLIVPPQIVSTTPQVSGPLWITYPQTLNVGVSAVVPTNYPLTYCWQLNGTNIGSNSASYSISNMTSASDGCYTVTVTNAAGSTNMTWDIRVALPGMVEAWGDDDYGECDRPAALTNVSGIAAGEYQSILVTDTGTVAQWGQYWDGGTEFLPVNDANATQPPASNVVAVAAGAGQALALMTDGTVRAWGWNGAYGTHVPAGLSGVKAIGCGWDFNNALLTNGTVVCWGNDDFGQTDMPAGLNNVTAIATGGQHSLALRSDGTVVAWGYDGVGQTNVPAGLNNVVAVAAGGQHSMALQANGIVVAWGDNGWGQTNVPAGLNNVMAIAGGWAHSVALRNDGTIVEWGDNSFGQTTVPAQVPTSTPIPSRLIAAGGDHTMAAIFCPWVQYPVDVTRDLVLVYNTNYYGGSGSSNVCQYYLANRPMVGNCTNVIAIGADVGPGCWPDDFTNNLINPIQSWFAANPTRIPTYIILFQDTPSFVVIGNSTPYSALTTSVQYQLRMALSATWAPFITSINMDPTGGTNSCIAYINKLASMSSNNPPGSLFLSGTAAGYGNTNWYFDDVSPGYFGTSGYKALEGVEAAGVSSNAITYVPFTSTTDINNCTNVAGYFSWGAHADLPANYATNGAVSFYSNSTWYVIATDESFNGQEDGHGGTQGDFTEWFSSNAFQCSNCSNTPYANTPVGAICHVDEPYACSDNTYGYFGNWAAGKSFAICAWSGQIGTYGGGFTDEEFEAVGDPFVMK
jgi:alpha-tubulin suppressor-like RCC1 family protein